ncbi:PDZ domain-containing protein [Marinihelvus fidelis]|uniref:PDZ domain-containing protein n=2 Tax=Marinihelvus fidelis TaxID=2613842 RepID=A0A5N0TC01_9GAMM|nr:PDZ domain-containing protein [Marinihelvus fidelis]
MGRKRPNGDTTTTGNMSKTLQWAGFVFRSAIAGLALAFLVIIALPQLRERLLAAPEPGQAAPPAMTSFAGAVDRAAPSVVSLYTQSVELQAVNPQAQRPQYLARYRRDMGSGVLMSEDGLILTNNHVINQVQSIGVALWDGRIASAEVVGSDPATDLAVLRINFTGLPAAPLAEGNVRVGDVVLAIGNALGLSHTVTMGIVSATGRNDLRSPLYEDFIQTDAAINAGNSGGALVNVEGEVVGINTRNLGRAVGGQNIGFAIPISLARDVMAQIIEYGSVRRGWLGATFLDLPLATLADGSAGRQGVRILEVEPGGPAWNAGIRSGDILVSINGTAVEDARAAQLDIAERDPGDEVELVIQREGDRFETHAFLIQQPPVR